MKHLLLKVAVTPRENIAGSDETLKSMSYESLASIITGRLQFPETTHLNFEVVEARPFAPGKTTEQHKRDTIDYCLRAFLIASGKRVQIFEQAGRISAEVKIGQCTYAGHGDDISESLVQLVRCLQEVWN